MKKLLFLFFLVFTFGSAMATSVTVYGKNEGTTIETVTETRPDGTKIVRTTATIQCNSFYSETCYTLQSINSTEHQLTYGVGPNSDVPSGTVTGVLVSYNSGNHVVVLENQL